MKKEIPIKAFKCRKCGRIHYPFHDRCLDCKGREFEEIKPEGEARLLAFTSIFNLPWGFDQRYLLIGIAEFGNNIKAMGQIKAESVDQLKHGMRLRVSWEPVRMQHGEAIYGLMYEPVK
jgi:scaffold protein (connect acetoacetyl-CoA thiolase and HMG-CoA synthase)